MNDTEPLNRRMFFGIRPPPDVARRLHAMARTVARDGARPVPLANLHLTLYFVGQVAEPDCLVQGAGAIDGTPFTFTINTLGFFARARVAWAGPDGPVPRLVALAGGCRAVAERCEGPGDGRDFVPHVTLARKVRRPPTLERIEPIVWPVDRFQLFWSRNHGNGVEYEVVAEFPLRGRGASGGTGST